MKFEYYPKGTCSTKMIFDINDNKIDSFDVENGCKGNLKGIKSLITGMDIDEVISKLEGIRCGFKNTSCPDQIAKALLLYKNK